MIGQQNPHRLSHWPAQYLICATSPFLSGGGKATEQDPGNGPEDLGRSDSTTPTSTAGRPGQAAGPRLVGGWLGQTGPIVAFAVADASTYRTGYQITLVPDTVLRGSLPLSPQERGMHHTVQESVGTNHVAMAAILQLDLRGSPDLPVRLSSGNDNSAAVKNISKPGNKPQMVLHQVETQLEARARHVIVVGQKQSKYFMDHQTNIDWDGRRLYRYPDLGLHPQLVQLAATLLGKPIDESTVDMVACRVTRQTRQYVARYPDGDTDRITQCDVQTFHLGEHHLLSGSKTCTFTLRR